MECECDFYDPSELGHHTADCPENNRGAGRPPTAPITPEERTWMDSLVERVPAKDMTGWIVAR